MDVDHSLKIVNNLQFVLPQSRKYLFQVILDGQYYNVYEYTMDDLLILEHIEKKEGPMTLVLEMLLRAIPDCPDYILYSLSSTELNELVYAIQDTSIIARSIGKGFLYNNPENITDKING